MRRLRLILLPLSFALATPLVQAQDLAAAAPPAATAQDLPAAITAALGHAPELAEAEASAAAARARLDRARAEGNPLLRVEGSVGAGRIDNGGFFGITADNVTPLAMQATAEMPLYAGGRIAAASDQARGGAEIARLGAEQAKLQTVVGAVAAYAEVLTARRLVERFGKLDGELAETERQAGLLFRSGSVTSTDVAQARARRAEGQAGLAQAEGRLASAEARFERLTGQRAGALAPLPALPATPATLDEAVDAARARNPSLLQARKGIDVARADLRAAKAEGLPTVGAFAEAAHVRDQFFPNYRADSVAVGVRGRWTVFAGGRVAAQTRAAGAELDAAEARERGASQALDGMVIDAWQGLRTAGRMVDAGALRSDAANEALRGARLEAQVGARTTLDVLDAEREALEAEAALIEAQGQRLVAAYRLNALTGSVSAD